MEHKTNKMNTTVIGAFCFILALIGLFVFLATKKSDFNKDEEPSLPKPEPESIPTPLSDRKTPPPNAES
jgi:nitric oxide reductase large subunit